MEVQPSRDHQAQFAISSQYHGNGTRSESAIFQELPVIGNSPSLLRAGLGDLALQPTKNNDVVVHYPLQSGAHQYHGMVAASDAAERKENQVQQHNAQQNTATSKGNIVGFGRRLSTRSEICVSPSWQADMERKQRKKAMKRMEKERKEAEKSSKSQSKRDDQDSKRQSRRLTKKQPLGNSSRASSVNSTRPQSSSAVSLSSLWNNRGSRSSSIEPKPTRSRRQSSDSTRPPSSFMPRFSGFWPQRFTAVISQNLADPEKESSDTDSVPSRVPERSLHPTRKHYNLRASAKAFETTAHDGRRFSFDLSKEHLPMSQNLNPLSSECPNIQAFGNAVEANSSSSNTRTSLGLPDSAKPLPSPPLPQNSNNINSSWSIERDEQSLSAENTPSQTRARHSTARHRNKTSLPRERLDSPMNDSTNVSKPENEVPSVNDAQVRKGKRRRLTKEMKQGTAGKPPSRGSKEPEADTNNEVVSSISPVEPLVIQEPREVSTPFPDLDPAPSSASTDVDGGAVETSETPDTMSDIAKEEALSAPPIPPRNREARFKSSPLAGPPLSSNIYNDKKNESTDQGPNATAIDDSGEAQEQVPTSRRRRRSSLLSIYHRMNTGKKDKRASSIDTTKDKELQNHSKGKQPATSPAKDTNILKTEPRSNAPKLPIENDSNISLPTSHPIPRPNGVKTSKLRELNGTSSLPVNIFRNGASSGHPLRNSVTIVQNIQPRAEGTTTGRKKLSTSVDLTDLMPPKPAFKRNSTAPTQTLLSPKPEIGPSQPARVISTTNISKTPFLRSESSPAFPNSIRDVNADTEADVDTRPSSPSIHSMFGSSGSPSIRGPRHRTSKQVAKMFVICCQCNFWHDMPSDVYAKLAFPNGSPPSRSPERPINLADSRESLLVMAGSSKRNNGKSPVSGGTNGKAGNGKGPLLSSSRSSSASDSAVKCCWCSHRMTKGCCAGWTTIVHFHERHH
ncbi:hypothetical protein AJ80_04990 [Polytolypa hystricis UAMH7299]|uniref:Uncharacterized protein n=1 Tax=Polytolypa hystricis (strain UAMH7299) TaxID=1447883 RepID=A0A2B7Y7R8_POLH7|nr:hypothetical protein AJ80_04990 [Polytolypa hystricis UAMH7299]